MILRKLYCLSCLIFSDVNKKLVSMKLPMETTNANNTDPRYSHNGSGF